MKRNEVVIDGRLLKRSALRYTPAGIPVLDLLLGHSSNQIEAGGKREVCCEIEAVAIGDMALKLNAAKLNRPLQFCGFLAQRSVNNRKLVLHIQSMEAVTGGS